MAQRIATQMTTHQTNPIDLPKLLVPVLFGHLKAEGHLGRCYLKGRTGDAANVVLSAVGHNLRRILAWLRELCCLFLFALWRTLPCPAPLNPAS
jgi:IS5 family transposase